MKIRRTWGIFLGGMLLLCWGCGDPAEEPVLEADLAPRRIESHQIHRVEPEDIPVFATAVGATQSYRRATPGTPLMGRVVAVLVEEGDAVKRGQLLARIEKRGLQARRLQAVSALAEAEAVMANSGKNLERIGALRQDRAATQQQLDEAETAHQRAVAAAEAAREGVKAADEQLRHTAVRSPLDGIVVKKSIEVGDVANPGVALFAIEQSAPAKITLAISERDIRFLPVGQTVEVEIKALGKTVPARVKSFVPAADPTSHTFSLEVVVLDSLGPVASGLFARVRFAKGMRSVLLVPAGAITQRGQLRGVYVVVDGHLRLRWVRLGQTVDGRVEVLAGLRPGDRVVVAAVEAWRDGMPVEVEGDG
jgi:membrane fusion protein, multidrug efflux system